MTIQVRAKTVAFEKWYENCKENWKRRLTGREDRQAGGRVAGKTADHANRHNGDKNTPTNAPEMWH